MTLGWKSFPVLGIRLLVNGQFWCGLVGFVCTMDSETVSVFRMNEFSALLGANRALVPSCCRLRTIKKPNSITLESGVSVPESVNEPWSLTKMTRLTNG